MYLHKQKQTVAWGLGADTNMTDEGSAGGFVEAGVTQQSQ